MKGPVALAMLEIEVPQRDQSPVQGERRSYLSSPIERPERKIIQQRNNYPKPSKLPNLSTGKGNLFILFFYKIESIFESKGKAEKSPNSPSHRVVGRQRPYGPTEGNRNISSQQ